MNNFFDIKNVDFQIGGKIKVKNVSFSIKNEGEIICLLGPSGIGKTTILRSIAGLEKINNGTIKLKGKLLSSNKENIDALTKFFKTKYEFVDPKNKGYIVEHSSNIYVLDKKLQVKKIIPNGIPSTEITRIVKKFL